MTRRCKMVPPARNHYSDLGIRPPFTASDLMDEFNRLSISGLGWDSDGGRNQRSPQLFQQWMRGDANSKTVLSKLGYGKDDGRAQRQPSLPQKQPSLTVGKYNGDAPHVDLHIHIDHNNIGSLSLGMNDRTGA